MLIPLILFLWFYATPLLAAETTVPLAEVDALKIKVLMLERQLIQEQVSRVQAQAQVQFAEKAKALNAQIEQSAKNAKVDLADGWQPDVEKKQWKKGKP